MRGIWKVCVAGLFLAMLSAGQAFANPWNEYRDGMIKDALAEGKTVFVDYAAHWCGTCRRQKQIIGQLLDTSPDYADKIMFVRVDWDRFRGEEVATSRKIPRRSTLLMLKGEEELGRLVASTRKSDIKALLDLGL